MAPGARPAFGVARPMKGGIDPAAQGAGAVPIPGGDQFPPLPNIDEPTDAQSRNAGLGEFAPSRSCSDLRALEFRRGPQVVVP